jgi:hypothetical protein
LKDILNTEFSLCNTISIIIAPPLGVSKLGDQLVSNVEKRDVCCLRLKGVVEGMVVVGRRRVKTQRGERMTKYYQPASDESGDIKSLHIIV